MSRARTLAACALVTLAALAAPAAPAAAQPMTPLPPGVGPSRDPAPVPIAPLPGPRPPREPAAAPAPPVPGVLGLEVRAPKNDDGRHLVVTFARAADVADDVVTLIFRRPHGTPGAAAAYPELLAPADAGPRTWAEAFAGPNPPEVGKLALGDAVGPWTVATVLEGGETDFTDEVAPGGSYEYVVVEARRGPGKVIVATSPAAVLGPRNPEAAWFNTGRAGILAVVLLIAALIGWYVRAARDKKELYIRRLPGVDAIEDAIGRSTEMGRPVLYVTGLEDIQNIQTIASLLILGHVAEKTAEYDTDLTVANYYPLTMIVAEEVVRQGYANAGRIDAHRPERCLFITAEQFAFAAGVSGIILRDRPATNIYFGAFYGESLLLAETGFLTGAVQIAGTAELTQLPFFITACDYTLIGEELYAASAYLTKEPTLLANLKAGDAFKMLAMLFIVVGVILATAGVFDLGPKVFP
ncbi:MAG: hypothetical protein IPL61_18320 [Myxococcales bacterium]|nr:hypothetical protein [Myxococcales bacterium]